MVDVARAVVAKSSYSWTVAPEEGGLRLGAFLGRKLPEKLSTRSIKSALEDNACTVNDSAERHASRTLVAGDKVVFTATAPVTPQVTEVLFEDEALLVVNKAPGIAVDSDDGLLTQMQQSHGEVHMVHRLDKDTSGVMLFAKSEQAQQNLEVQFKRRDVEKQYLAIVAGLLEKSRGTIINKLDKVHSYQGQTLWGSVKQGGHRAETRWERLARGKDTSLVLCKPKTGRTHQLRVHLSELGYAIAGDYQYARDQSLTPRPRRQMLHAWKITFHHPDSGDTVSFEAPLPPDFVEALQVFGLQTP